MTLAPGWNEKEVEVFKLAMQKYGVGNWKTIISERILPGKTNAQLVCQAQRLLGQQSLGEFQKLHLDIDKIREKNGAKKGVQRKSGLVIHSGDRLSKAQVEELKKQNVADFGLSEDDIKAIIIPSLADDQISNVLVDSVVKEVAIKHQLLQQLCLLRKREVELKNIVSNDQRKAVEKQLWIKNEKENLNRTRKKRTKALKSSSKKKPKSTKKNKRKKTSRSSSRTRKPVRKVEEENMMEEEESEERPEQEDNKPYIVNGIPFASEMEYMQQMQMQQEQFC
eukprot:g375.t1